MSAFLAGERDPRHALGSRDAVGSAALAALGFDARVALFHHQNFALHAFANKPFGLFAHRLLAHTVILASIASADAALWFVERL
jgi:hypothetical protein